MSEVNRLTEIAVEVGQLLIKRNWTLAVAESCTGGLVGDSVTNVPGSSAFFVGGVIAYANRIKRDILRVDESLLIVHGAVAKQVAAAMARGSREVLGTDVGIAVTGIAGPTGGSLGKPVGTVFVAVSSPLGEKVKRHRWTSNRRGNKLLSAEAVLSLLREELLS